ncbi:MAG: hypothetical protein ABW051_11270 [Burkholderiaceae bacterium]
MVGEPDAYAGELPVAFVTLRPGMDAQAEEILACCAPNVYERPAVPKRVTVIDAMPVTAIGKIYKPTLRLRAIEEKLREVLAPVMNARSFSVAAREEGARLLARVEIRDVREESLVAGLASALAAIAVPVEFSFLDQG